REGFMLMPIFKPRFGLFLAVLIVLSSYQSGWEGSPGFVKAAAQDCTKIVLTPRNLPPGSVGIAYSQKLTVVGQGANERPLVFQLVSGVLPDGLGLNTDSGQVSGTPTMAGTFPFSASVTNAVGCTSSQNYTIKINAPTCQTITLSSSLPNGIVGT